MCDIIIMQRGDFANYVRLYCVLINKYMMRDLEFVPYHRYSRGSAVGQSSEIRRVFNNVRIYR